MKNYLFKIIVFVNLLFLITYCSFGPHIEREYEGERLKISTDDNKLGGSYWKGDDVSTLEINLNLSQKRERKTFWLAVVYYGNGRVLEEEDKSLVVDFDGELKVYKIDNLLKASEFITKKVRTGEIVDKGKFFEYATYDITYEDVELFAKSKSIKIVRLGSNTSGIWYFNDENKQVVRDFFKELYKF